MDFFFPSSVICGRGGEAQENPEVLIIDYFLLLSWGFIIVIIGIFEALPAARCFLHLSCGASGQWECATIRIPSPGAKKKRPGNGVWERAEALPGTFPARIPSPPPAATERGRQGPLQTQEMGTKTESQPSLASLAGVQWCFTL